MFPDRSLADLYDPLKMPGDLQMAHRKLDRAILKGYRFHGDDISESDIVAELMRRYIVLTATCYETTLGTAKNKPQRVSSPRSADSAKRREEDASLTGC